MDQGPKRGQGRKLGDVCGGRDNNFNLIRMVAASAVLVSHAFPISLGAGTPEPLETLLGRSLGSISVLVFFAISGFLIARSFDRSPRLSDWLAARIMRLFPGLAVVLLLTAFVLGPLVSVLPPAVYFRDPAVGTYVLRNIVLVSQQYGLPGVFETLPLPVAINGSLWTLFYEVLCYGGVMLAGLAGALYRPRRAIWGFAGLLVLYVILSLPWVASAMHPKVLLLHRLALPFAIGTALYVWRDRVPLGWGWAVGLGMATAVLHDTALFSEAFAIWLAYTVFVLAYLPGGPIRRYNDFGDYSYGIYIYAFPVQQTVMHLFGPMTPLENMAIGFPVTLVCAVLSWRLVEKPGLAARHRLANLLGRGTPGMRHRL